MDEASEWANLRAQVAQLEHARVKQARRSATMFGVIAVAGLIAGVFGFVQQEASKRCHALAIGLEEKALRMETEALAARDRAEIAAKTVEQLTIELEICKAVRKQ